MPAKLLTLLLTLLITAALAPVQAQEAAAPDPAAASNDSNTSNTPNALGFILAPRDSPVKDFPCTRCHRESKPADPTPRRLKVRHPQLNHGDGQFWCLACHHPQEHNQLTTLAGQPVVFEETHRVCGQCHAAQQRDWLFGAHGKRLGSWQGERQILDCTRCHNPHDPTIKPRAPLPAPSVRYGLDQGAVSRGRSLAPIWERYDSALPPSVTQPESDDVRQ